MAPSSPRRPLSHWFGSGCALLLLLLQQPIPVLGNLQVPGFERDGVPGAQTPEEQLVKVFGSKVKSLAPLPVSLPSDRTALHCTVALHRTEVHLTPSERPWR